MSSVRQTNFSAGELDPLLQGRTDLPIHGQGLATCQNFFITKQGAASSRPGTIFVREARDGRASTTDSLDTTPIRLIPFVYGDSESYVLEFTVGFIRIHTLGRTVMDPNEVTEPLSISTAITAELLPLIKYAQTGNVLTVCVPGTAFTAPYELKRVNPTTWTWGRTSFRPPDPIMDDVGSSLFFDPFDPGAVASQILTTPFMLVDPLPTATTDQPAREWIYAFTAIMQRKSDGAIFESSAQVVKYITDGVNHYGIDADPIVQVPLTTNSVCVYPDKAVTLKRLGLEAATNTAYRTLSYRIYRGRGDLLGWIGDTRSREFIDVGDEPDYAVQPPIGSNPFWLQQDSLRPGYLRPTTPPLAVTFFQERRCFGGALAGLLGTQPFAARPSTLFLSATGDYYNFDTRLAIHVAGEALEFELATRKAEVIRHLLGTDKLVVLTDSACWTVGGVQGSPLDFDSVDARRVDEVGSTHVVPLIVDGAVLFVRTKGTGARALLPQASDTPYQGIDLSDNARHLLRGAKRQIVDWTYQEDPFGLIWAVRSDGSLLSLTFSRERQMIAWAQHETDGKFEAVCAVPEGEEDAVYVAVRRTINGVDRRYIERFTSRVRRVLEDDDDPVFKTEPSVTDTDSLYPTDVCMDCCFTYAGPVVGAFEVEELERLEGKWVYVVARGIPLLGPFLVYNKGGGLYGFDIDFDVTPTTNAFDANGAPIWVAHVGIPFNCDLETLSLRGNEVTLRQKTIKEVGFELDSAKGVQAGQDFDNLDEWQQRTIDDGYNPIGAESVLLFTPVDNTWDKNARAVLRQSLPLPVTVVGITRELAIGDPD